MMYKQSTCNNVQVLYNTCIVFFVLHNFFSVYVVVIPCLPGVYTIYTRYCVNKPEGVARGFISTIPSVNGIHTRWAWNR